MLNSRAEPLTAKAREESSVGGQAFLLLLLSRVVSLLAGVAFVAVTARLFPASGIAFLAWLAILSSAAETVRGFGLTLVLTRRLPLCEHASAEARRWVTTHFLYASLPLLVLPILAGPFLPTLWTVAAAGAALQLVVNNHIYVFQAMGQFRTVTLGAIFSTILQRIAPLAAAWHWKMGMEPFLLIQALLSLPVCMVLTYQLREYLSSPTRVPWSEFWPQARAFYASGFVRYGATQADQVMVALLFPPQTLAPYFLVRRLYSALVVVLSAGVDVLTPQLGRRALAGIEQVRLDQARILKSATAICALGGGLIAANAGAVVPLVIGAGYSAPRFVVPALLLAALGYGLFSFAVAGEVVAGPPKETFRITLIAAVVPLVVAPFLVPLAVSLRFLSLWRLAT
jgi:O-antigen/teichoic acid export membrane protein